MIYSNITFKGMSGGPVLNEAGELVAIHGQGDRDDTNDGVAGEGEKTGRNLGIVVERFGAVALAMGVQLDQQVAAIPRSQVINASDYFLRGVSKHQQGDYRGALADYNQTIAFDPKFSKAYYNRGNLKAKKLNDIQGALADFNQAISLNPRYAYAYHSRAILKWEKLNDVQGALTDFNQAISLDSKLPQAYYNRGNLKFGEGGLNDPQGALADFNQAIFLDPKYANAYDSRARLKLELNDKAGAIRDFRTAAQLFRTQGKTQELRYALDQLRELKASE
jgi:tetratricopeptide (TPR) repeat protein